MKSLHLQFVWMKYVFHLIEINKDVHTDVSERSTHYHVCGSCHS